MDDDGPNARVINEDEEDMKVINYGRADNTLKIRYDAKSEDGSSWLDFSPGRLKVELDGVPLRTVRSLHLHIDRYDIPIVTLGFTLKEVDIDADTMVALQAFVKGQNGESDSKEEGASEQGV